jgi:hypothetical protein
MWVCVSRYISNDIAKCMWCEGYYNEVAFMHFTKRMAHTTGYITTTTILIK